MPGHSRGQHCTQQDGALIFWLLPIVVAVDTQVHCERSHLPWLSCSSSQQIPALRWSVNRIRYSCCIMRRAQGIDKQHQRPCVVSHFIPVTPYLSPPHPISLSLFMLYTSSTLFLIFGQKKTMLPGNNRGRIGTVCVHSLSFENEK